MRTALKRSLLVLAIAGAPISVANAQSITTLFSNNNGGSAGGAVYFDLVPSGADITINSLDTNTSAAAGSTFGVSIYTVAGGYLPNVTNQAAWTLAATGVGTAAGADQPSPVTLSGPVTLPSGMTHGIAIVLAAPGQTSASHAYSGLGTSPAPGQTTYSNADLTLNLGSALNIPFTGTPFTPRIWNGTLYYTAGAPVAGACCLANGTCVSVLPADCFNQGGTYQGPNTTCGGVVCPQPGSCCFFDGTCQVLLQTACTGQGGTFTAGGTCTPNTCPPPPPLACAMSTGATSLAGQPAPAGGTWSECARDYNDPTTANTTAGFNALAGTYRIADDFQVSAGQTITAMRFPAYQTGALGTTITALTLQIWDGPPDNPASTVVFGDTFTNRMTNVSLSNIYRCFNTVTPPTCGGAPTLPDSGRHIQWVDAGNLNIQLPAGTYWVDFDVAGTAASGPWVPPSTSDTAIGRQCDLSDSNALQSVGGVWQPLNDTGQGCAPTPVQQKVYFEITATGGGCYANCDNSTTAPVLNVADFTCFLQAFAAGCP